jgi:hypothetical protein
MARERLVSVAGREAGFAIALPRPRAEYDLALCPELLALETEGGVGNMIKL